MISINDLKGFDFSKKYVDIAKEVNLNYKGKDFTITPRLKDGEIDSLKCIYKINNREYCGGGSDLNPFALIKRLYLDIIEIESNLEFTVKLLKDLLGEYAPKKTNWYDLKSKLSVHYSCVIDYYPNYESEIFPNNLKDEDLLYYVISKFYPNVNKKTCPDEDSLCDLYSDEGANKLKNFLNKITALDYAILIQNGFEFWFMIQRINESKNNNNELSPNENKPIYLCDYDNIKNSDSIKNSCSRLTYECQDLYFDTILKMFKINIPNKEIKKDIYEIIFEKKNPNMRIELLKERGVELTINRLYMGRRDDDCFKRVEGDFSFDLNDLYLKEIYYRYLESINKKRSYISHYLFKEENKIIDETICNSHTIHQEAIKNKHIKEGHGKGVLRFAKNIPELKEVLKKYNLKVGGKRDELINRLESNLTEEEINKEFPGNIYILTQEGMNFYNKYSKTFKYKKYMPYSFYFDEFIEICDNNPNYTPEDILFVLMKEKWITCSKPLSYSAKDKFSSVNIFPYIIEDVFRKIRPDLVEELLKSE